jgi:hypothetical protein
MDPTASLCYCKRSPTVPVGLGDDSFSTLLFTAQSPRASLFSATYTRTKKRYCHGETGLLYRISQNKLAEAFAPATPGMLPSGFEDHQEFVTGYENSLLYTILQSLTRNGFCPVLIEFDPFGSCRDKNVIVPWRLHQNPRPVAPEGDAPSWLNEGASDQACAQNLAPWR